MPTLGNGKICHLAIPALDVEASAAFYEDHFGFTVRRQPNRVTFDDGVDEVSGHFVPQAAPMREAGILVYIMVDDLVSMVSRLEAADVEIVAAPGVDPGELTAHIRDPAGNLLGIYQEPDQGD